MVDTRSPELKAFDESLRFDGVKCSSCSFEPSDANFSTTRKVGYHTRSYVEVASLAHQINATFLYVKVRRQSSIIAPTWSKPFALMHVMEDVGTKYDFVLYMDTDITVAGYERNWFGFLSQLNHILEKEEFELPVPDSRRVQRSTLANASVIAALGAQCGTGDVGNPDPRCAMYAQNTYCTSSLLMRPNSVVKAILAEWVQTWDPCINDTSVTSISDQFGFNMLHQKFPRQIATMAADYALDLGDAGKTHWISYSIHDCLSAQKRDVFAHNNKVLMKAVNASSVSGITLLRHRVKTMATVEEIQSHAGSHLPSVLSSTSALIKEFDLDSVVPR